MKTFALTSRLVLTYICVNKEFYRCKEKNTREREQKVKTLVTIYLTDCLCVWVYMFVCDCSFQQLEGCWSISCFITLFQCL